MIRQPSRRQSGHKESEEDDMVSRLELNIGAFCQHKAQSLD